MRPLGKKKDKKPAPFLYRFSLMREPDERQLLYGRLSKPVLVWAVVVAAAVLVAVIYCLIALTPVRTLIPGYPNAASKAAAVQNAIKIDSLESLMTRWDIYAENLRRVVDGDAPLSVDSVMRERSSAPSDTAAIDADALAKSDSLLRAVVSEEEQFDLSGTERRLPVEGLHFFTPLRGVVSRQFDPVLHPYVDITAPAGSVVMSVLDGTVIFTDWSEEGMYTIVIQHQQDLISIYMHNQTLLKGVGDRVSAGSPVALLGSNVSLSNSGDHLHFEMWHAGEALDPALYISF